MRVQEERARARLLERERVDWGTRVRAGRIWQMRSRASARLSYIQDVCNCFRVNMYLRLPLRARAAVRC